MCEFWPKFARDWSPKSRRETRIRHARNLRACISLIRRNLIWRRGWDSNPRALSDKTLSRRPRYDHFGTSPSTWRARSPAATSLRRALTLTPLRSLFAARSAPFAATRMRGPAGDFASLRADAYSTTLAPRCSFRSVRGDSHARHLPATSLRCALTLTPLRSLFAARSGPFTPTARAAPARDFASPRAYSLRSCDLHSDSRRPLKNS
jgi:hypothetical protein